ncbi:hypothetical protein B0T25DRAFT_562815 [Lasiosphaeria hispida]|uniref:Uncharacterized protein n=1 Tax=Lasiosphaeria hispida TaxID=260671 RepID=A0AAJ0HW85_9PEZI|nr:hypothetical protein B0T25DRAFT_562815 [Lasiosphaeria hispida]
MSRRIPDARPPRIINRRHRSWQTPQTMACAGHSRVTCVSAPCVMLVEKPSGVGIEHGTERQRGCMAAHQYGLKPSFILVIFVILILLILLIFHMLVILVMLAIFVMLVMLVIQGQESVE